jgi:hypothetical protein
VVVPSHLIRQWKSEFEKFTDGLTVFPIYDLTSLLKLSVKDVTGCDCIILPVDILESKDYLQHVLEMGGSSSKDCPNMPRYVGQKEMAGASGVWVPATSADPYGGSNNVSVLTFYILPRIFHAQLIFLKLFLGLRG